MAEDALFSRHPMMPTWPHDFDFYVIRIKSIWLIDIYGGAKDVDLEEYYAVDNSVNLKDSERDRNLV